MDDMAKGDVGSTIPPISKQICGLAETMHITMLFHNKRRETGEVQHSLPCLNSLINAFL